MAHKAKKRPAARARTRARPDLDTPLRRAPRPITSIAVTARKAVSDPETDPLALPSTMEETNGGGSIEQVPGFNVFRAVTSGFETRRVAGPTTVMARPDGGFFSEGGCSSRSCRPPRSVHRHRSPRTSSASIAASWWRTPRQYLGGASVIWRWSMSSGRSASEQAF